jgi:hypothetical protein
MEPNVYKWSSMPGEWRMYDPSTGIVTVGKTSGECLAAFEALSNGRAYRVIEGPPPQSNVQPFVTRATALAACHAKWTQRLRLAARDGLVDSIEAAAALDELFELATK